MNKARRKEIARAIDLIEDARGILEEVKDEEETAFSNMPESLQESDGGKRSEEAVGHIDEAISELDSIVDALEGAKA